MMLPDLMPHDSDALWYSSSRGPIPSFFLDPAQNLNGHPHNNDGLHDSVQGHPVRRHGAAAVERSALARLRADEALQERRRHNVGNFGATWLKPPGITKSLYQLREERREAEEHAEAMRREQLAQQLAEAEVDGEGVLEGEVDVMDEVEDVDEEGAGGEAPVERDLDDEIPDADDGFGYDGATTTSEEEDSEDSDDDDTDNSPSGHGRGSIVSASQRPSDSNAAAQQRRELRQAVATEDRFLGVMARGQAAHDREDDMYPGADDDIDEEEADDMLQEDDLIHASYENGGMDDGLDMDMNGDLDDDIPEAESGGYEHTDSDASLTSSDEDDDGPAETSFAQGHPSATPQFRNVNLRAQRQYGNPRSSLDLSSVLSRDGSSLPGSSPQAQRRH